MVLYLRIIDLSQSSKSLIVKNIKFCFTIYYSRYTEFVDIGQNSMYPTAFDS